MNSAFVHSNISMKFVKNFSSEKIHYTVLVKYSETLLLRAFRQPVSRKHHESFVLSGWGSMHKPYIESATALSDNQIFLLNFFY